MPIPPPPPPPPGPPPPPTLSQVGAAWYSGPVRVAGEVASLHVVLLARDPCLSLDQLESSLGELWVTPGPQFPLQQSLYVKGATLGSLC